MPCYDTSRLQRLERERIEAQRIEAISQIEQELATGIAQLSVNPLTGEVSVFNSTVQPEGMTDVCIMAALQQHNSVGFQMAVTQAQAQGIDFVALHGHSHSH